MEEIWKDIPGYEAIYLASNLGRIMSLARVRKTPTGGYRQYPERILKPSISPAGYYTATLFNFNVTSFTVHRLVALAWLPNPDRLPVVNHKDSNRLNNHINNLEWCTLSHNSKHSYDAGRQNGLIKSHLLNLKDIIYLNTGKVYPSIRAAYDDLRPLYTYETFKNRIDKNLINVKYYETKTK